MRPMYFAVPLLLVAQVAALSGADVVVLKNGHRISGVLDPTIDVEPDQVAINTGHGIMCLPKSAIASEELGFDARKKRLKEDDFAGHFRLAYWCNTNDMNEQALSLLDRAVKMPGATLQSRALHARLVDLDGNRGPDEALELYRSYQKDGGEDPATLARLAQLEKTIADFETQANSVKSTALIPKALPTVQATMESKGWDNEAPQWSNPVKPHLITVSTEAGLAPALKIEFKGGPQAKATIKRTAHLTIGANSVLTFFAQNPGDKPLTIAIGVKTGPKYLFHESPQQQIKPGAEFQRLKFDFQSSNFKSAASGWNNNSRVADLNDVKEIQLLIYNGNADGALIINNMGFPAKPDL